MSEIKRYGVWDKPPREDLVTYADHEAAIALRTRVCAEAFEDELARTEERVLADAKARIGRLAAPNGSYGEAEWGFLRGVTAALAALTQPQGEEPGPYAKAFRERVCPVPEFPGIKAGSVDRYPDHVAPAPQTEGECARCGGKGTVLAPRCDPKSDQFTLCPTCSGTGKEGEK